MTLVFAHTEFSIGTAFCKIDELITDAVKRKINSIAIIDDMTVSGVPEFLKAIEKSNKKGGHQIQPIVGTTIKRCENGVFTDLILIAKNKNGYHNILRILGNAKYIDGTYCVENEIVAKYKSDLEFIQCEDIKNVVYYVTKSDRLLQQIVICAKLGLTLGDVDIIKDKYAAYAAFFDDSDQSLEGVALDDSHDYLLKLCEPFSVSGKPKLPTYIDDKGIKVTDPEELLTNLCRQGWKDRQINEITKGNDELRTVYADRIKMELDTFKQAKLSNYFLIILDIVQFARRSNTTACLRGSAAGCLISYLIGISDIDPVCPDASLPYHPDRSLIFARFYNSGRNSDTHISLPDVDVDVTPSIRNKVKEFIKNKYGNECFAPYIIAFTRYDGRGALKEIFRVLGTVSAEMANEITGYMTDKARISDELEECREKTPGYTTVQWNIDNVPQINDYYKEFTKEFDLAIRISDSISGITKHAAGVVISPTPLSESFPILIDETTGDKILALEMDDAEYCGAVKYDLLCVAALQKIDVIINMINNNLSEPQVSEEFEEVND